MERHHFHYLAALTVLVIFGLTAAWEFALEDLAWHVFYGNHVHVSVGQKWEFITAATVSATIAAVIFDWIGQRTIAERKRARAALRKSEALLSLDYRQLAGRDNPKRGGRTLSACQ